RSVLVTYRLRFPMWKKSPGVCSPLAPRPVDKPMRFAMRRDTSVRSFSATRMAFWCSLTKEVQDAPCKKRLVSIPWPLHGDRIAIKMLPERKTVGTLLAHLAQAMPQQEAVVFPPWRLTYAALYAQAAVVAS